ncbi:hypothetical protein Bca4012_054878 [Brassica carinata]|uniref:Probable purine permease n=1 Tax=Brassica carinata TaxID=52824 RepID=A0A8X8B024_BRACI|nr:hypothetical protein Bca52824_012122 [Brassica carinata]
MKNSLLIIVCIFLAIGTCGGPLLTRLYYTNGGTRIWFMSFLATAGCPVILIPLYKTQIKQRLFLMETPLFIASIVIGLLIGLDNYLYAYGLAYLPVSTSSLIVGTQLAFNAIFAFFMVKQKFTPFSIDAVVLLTVGTGILALHADGDRPADVSKKEYVVGFLLTLFAAKVRQEITFTLVLEMQMVMCVASTCFCLVGMLVKGDFELKQRIISCMDIPRETREFMIGGSVFYYTLIVIIGIVWQCFFLGALGVVFCASSLASGVLVSVLLPVTEILAVICFREKFQAEKGVALLVSLWGFASYFYAEFKSGKKIIDSPQSPETELPPLPVSGSVV